MNSNLSNILNQAFYTPIEIAAILRIDVQTVRTKLKAGIIKGKKVDGAWRTSRADLFDYLKEIYE